MLFYCPRCQKELDKLDEQVLQEGTCPHCSGQLYAGGAVTQDPDQNWLIRSTFEPFANVAVVHRRGAQHWCGENEEEA